MIKAKNINTFLTITYMYIIACKVVQTYGNYDLCGIIKRELSASAYKMLNGHVKYAVGVTYHAGYIPGCEPRYSAPCNQGYYTYNFSRV